jgi:hypothetical protein
MCEQVLGEDEIEQRFRPADGLVVMPVPGGTLEDGQKIAPMLRAHKLRLLLDPGEASFHQLLISDSDDVVLPDEIGLELSDTSVGAGVETL